MIKSGARVDKFREGEDRARVVIVPAFFEVEVEGHSDFLSLEGVSLTGGVCKHEATNRQSRLAA